MHKTDTENSPSLIFDFFFKVSYDGGHILLLSILTSTEVKGNSMNNVDMGILNSVCYLHNIFHNANLVLKINKF